MKATEKAELRGQSVEDLTALAAEKREALLKGRIGQALEGEGLGVQARKLRRDIAVIETILTEKKKVQA